MRLSHCICFILLLASTASADPDPAQLLSQISGSDPAQQRAAVAEISDTLTEGKFQPPFIGQLRDKLLPAMVKAGLYSEVAAIAQQTVLTRPAIAFPFQRIRVQALLAANKPDDALVASKVLLYVCPIADTGHSIETLARCLRAAKGADAAALIDRFRSEQIAGSATQPADAVPLQPASQAPTSQPTSVLDSIVVDPKPYNDALIALPDGGYTATLAQGNVLLMAGRAKEAEKLFRDELLMAADKDIPKIQESIARAIRDEDGTIGRANSYILGLNGSAQEK